MAEVLDEATYVQHHKKKLVLIFSAMRHFAKALTANGINVDYVKLDDEENTGVLQGELATRAVVHLCDRIQVYAFGGHILPAALNPVLGTRVPLVDKVPQHADQHVVGLPNRRIS